MWLRLDGVALVEAGKTLELALRIGGIDALFQHRHVKTAARHVDQLVNQHVAGGADFAAELAALAQQARLAVGAAIGEFGKVQVDAGDAGQISRHRVGIVGQFKGILACKRLFVGGISYYFHSL